ncbi:UNVERIFIED_CONTAM: hypothetical protein NCL1_54467 [Trichonephila clavipes]
MWDYKYLFFPTQKETDTYTQFFCPYNLLPIHKIQKVKKTTLTSTVRRLSTLVQSIPGFQECDEDVETWTVSDAEDCGFQMLNDDEIVTSMQEDSDPIDDETDEDEDINYETRFPHVRISNIRIVSGSYTA